MEVFDQDRKRPLRGQALEEPAPGCEGLALLHSRLVAYRADERPQPRDEPFVLRVSAASRTAASSF